MPNAGVVRPALKRLKDLEIESLVRGSQPECHHLFANTLARPAGFMAVRPR
jgi:hypothetical protein